MLQAADLVIFLVSGMSVRALAALVRKNG